MSWDGLLAGIAERSPRERAQMEARKQAALEAMSSLGSRLRELGGTLELANAAREARLREQVDLSAIKQKVAEHRWGELSAAQIRAVPRFLLEFEPLLLAAFFKNFPGRWRSYLRQLIRLWSLSRTEDTWDSFADLSSLAPEEAWPIEQLVISRSLFLRRNGPLELAARATERSLPELSEALVAAGLPQRCELSAASLLGFLRVRTQERSNITLDVSWIMERAQVRSLLLPTRHNASGERAGSDAIQAHGVAVILEARRHRLIHASVLEKVDAHLLSRDSDFGDPRVGDSAQWRLVRTLNEAAFAEFLESLIRDDLTFFFGRAMKEEARKQFWLRYLKAIRRTVCVLDPTNARRLEAEKAALPPEVQGAMQRTRRFRGGDVSAFCLFFDEFVVVEFSHVGNAAYTYARDVFTEKVLTVTTKLWDVRDLKRNDVPNERWSHPLHWQGAFAERLRKRGVDWDHPRKTQQH